MDQPVSQLAKEGMISSTEKNMEPAPAKPAKNIKFFLAGLLFLLLAIAAAAGGFGIYRVYAQTAQDSFSLTVAKVLRLPVLKVNGESVRYTDYIDDLKAIYAMRNYDISTNGPGAKLTDDQMSDQVLWRLVNNILIKNAAVGFGLTVSAKDLADLKAQVLKQFKSPADADHELQKRYGWNMSIYETKVMRPFILQNKLGEKIQLDQAARDLVRQDAQKVLDRVKKGEDFATLAKQYGEDGTAAGGGSLGWFGKGEMVPQFETAAFALKKGELSQDLVETPYGYHIIRVDDRKMVTTKDAKGKNVQQEQILASHILFRFPSIDKFMTQQIKQADIHLYGKMHNPFTAPVAAATPAN